MSLTEHLRDSGSPVRAYLDGISPSLADMQGRSSEARAMAQALGLTVLCRSGTVVEPLPGVDAARSGTAVDFRARIALGGFDPHDSAAALGVAVLPMYEDEAENGSHRVRVLTEAFDVAVRMLDAPSDEAELDRASLLLAHCEQIYRSGAAALRGSLGEALDAADDGLAFALGIDTPSLTDLRALMEANADQIDEWQARIAGGERFDPNPDFAGSALVGGADADWIVGDALIDSKAYDKLTVPTLRGFLRQLLGYVMLDLEDALGIRSVGVWFPRQRLTKTWRLDCLLGGDPEELLPALREGFRKAADGQQLAVREPVTQRRKHQILAENRHTPRRMLVDLARSEDADIRFRVGRNTATPEATLREIAQDRFAKAREGVARNVSTPGDVLAALVRDTSVGVRRAAADNPSTPKEPVRTLGRGRAAEAQPALEAPATESAALAPANMDHAAVQIRHDRGDAGLNSRWFAEFLIRTRGGTFQGRGSRIPVPKASWHWALQEARSLDIPEWLKAGLPAAVKTDLLREDRPAWVRRVVANDLPVSDPVIRDRLLADADPEIRWSALRRTVDAPDDALGDLLGSLAGDRQERIRFRTDGDDWPNQERDHTAAEYDRETLALVASHPSTPFTVLRELMTTKTTDVLVALMGNPELPADDLAELLPRLRRIRSSEHRERLAASGNVPAAVAEALVGDRDLGVRTALARNEATSAEALERLAQDPEPSVRLTVLVNPSTPAELAASIAEPGLASCVDEGLLDVLRAVDRRDDLVLSAGLVEGALDRLSKSRVRDPDMRTIAAGDDRTGPTTLKRLARSADEDVRCLVAGNAHTPYEALEALSEDPDSSVRAAAAGNEALDLDLLLTLVHDDEPDVRSSAASSSRLDPRLLAELLRDDDRSVRVSAYSNPATRPEDKARAESEWDRAWKKAAPSRADLEELVASSRAEVRMKVAFDPRTPLDFLVLLGGERRSAQVRRAVAANPNTPADVLASLAEDNDAEVRQAVAFNSATPPEILARLAECSIDLAILVALNPDAPLGILDALAEDPDPLVCFIASSTRSERSALMPPAGRRDRDRLARAGALPGR